MWRKRKRQMFAKNELKMASLRPSMHFLILVCGLRLKEVEGCHTPPWRSNGCLFTWLNLAAGDRDDQRTLRVVFPSYSLLSLPLSFSLLPQLFPSSEIKCPPSNVPNCNFRLLNRVLLLAGNRAVFSPHTIWSDSVWLDFISCSDSSRSYLKPQRLNISK